MNNALKQSLRSVIFNQYSEDKHYNLNYRPLQALANYSHILIDGLSNRISKLIVECDQRLEASATLNLVLKDYLKLGFSPKEKQVALNKLATSEIDLPVGIDRAYMLERYANNKYKLRDLTQEERTILANEPTALH